jgi:hypothetical protein
MILWPAALGEFFLQGPISAFVGTTGIGTSFEDIPFVENLDSATRGVLISPSIRCRASNCTRSAASIALGGFWVQHP